MTKAGTKKIKAWRPTERIFRDPIHGYIALDSEQFRYLQPLIDSPEFQRLRRVLQLGTTRYTYHGGEHSRFGHCMGMMWIVRNIIRRFRGDGVSVPKDTERNALTAALLHDVGHGPLSHVFEALTNKSFSHEAMTQRLIRESRLREDIEDPKGVSQLLKGIAPAEFRWVCNLLSGPLDADKMDYLLRDSYFTGTDYGRYDYARLFQSLIVYQSGRSHFLGVIEKGAAAAEAFVLARHRMYWSVYFHKTTRGVEMLLLSAFEKARDLIDKGKDLEIDSIFLKVVSGERLTPSDMIDFDDVALESQLRKWRHQGDDVLCDLSNRYFERRLLKAYIVKRDDEDVFTERQDLIIKKLQRGGIDTKYYYRRDFPSMFTYRPPYYVDEVERIVVIGTGKGGKDLATEITRYSPSLRPLQDEKQKEFRVYSTEKGRKLIAEVMGS